MGRSLVTRSQSDDRSAHMTTGHPLLIRMLLLASLLTGTAPGTIALGSGAQPSQVNVIATEFAYAPSKLSATSGPVTFVVTNKGSIEHNFVVEDSAKKKVAEIAIIVPGETTQVNAMVRPGTYAILCTLPGHKEAGMIAALQVQR